MPSKNKVQSKKLGVKKVEVKKEEIIVEKKVNKNIFIKSVIKRDGVVVPFDIEKRTNKRNEISALIKLKKKMIFPPQETVIFQEHKTDF